MKIIRAYRFAFDLTPSQECDVLARVGAARVAHNWAFVQVKAVMDQHTAERSLTGTVLPQGKMTNRVLPKAR